MSDTNFTNNVTLTDADWFNDLNRLHYTILGDPATLAALKTTISPITLTATQSATGTAVNFTSVPSGTKKIVIMFSGVSTNGTAIQRIQIGDSGGLETSGYTGCTSNNSASTAFSGSAGFDLNQASIAAASYNGNVCLFLADASTNTWICESSIAETSTPRTNWTSGAKSLSATLDRFTINMVGGADSFDAGNFSALYFA